MTITGKPTFTIVTHIVQLLKRDDVQHTHIVLQKNQLYKDTKQMKERKTLDRGIKIMLHH